MRNNESRARRGRAVGNGRQRARGIRSSDRDGFTIIELVVAIMILVVGVLGLAGTAGMVSRMVGGAAQQTVAASIASSRFETLRSVPCTQTTTGTATLRKMNEKRVVQQDAGNRKLYNISDEITYTAAGGRSRKLDFQSIILCE